jgi:protein-disulfide isomerase
MLRRPVLPILVAALACALPAAVRAQDPTPPVKGANVDSAVLEVVEFSDFQCPYCARALPVLDSLAALHGAEVRLVYRHYPLSSIHPDAERAAQAAVEAHRQGAFWDYHDLLFRHQDRLAGADLIGYADSLGLDAEAFGEALGAGTHAAAVAADRELGATLGVTGTPTFFVNGYRVVGVPPIWVFEETIRAFRRGTAERRPLSAPGGR